MLKKLLGALAQKGAALLFPGVWGLLLSRAMGVLLSGASPGIDTGGMLRVSSSTFSEDSFEIGVLLEPDPSSATQAALSHFRMENAGVEGRLFSRINDLEGKLSYGLPPQLSYGGYARLVRENLESSVNIYDYQKALARELFDIQIMELKSSLQEQLFNHILGETEQQLRSILEVSHYKDIRECAYDFIEEKVGSVNSARHSFQRNLLEGFLNSFLRDIQRNGTGSWIYREFYSHITDIMTSVYNLFFFFSYEVVYKNLNRTSLGLGLPPSLEEPYEAEAPRTVLKPSLSSNGA